MCELLQEYSNLDVHEDANIGANSSEAYNGSLAGGNNVTSNNISISFENTTSRIHQLKRILNIKKTSPEYTICQKMSVSEKKTILQYLFDEGKCGKICRKGIYIFINAHLNEKIIAYYLEQLNS